MPVSKNSGIRYFNGRRFLLDFTGGKADTKKQAAEARRAGFYVRITKAKGGYKLFISRK